MPNIDTWKWIGEKLGIPALAMCILFAILHYDLIMPMNTREERHATNQEAMAKALTTQTELLRTISYDTRYGTYRSTASPDPGTIPGAANPPPPPKLEPMK